ncbi:unnamed protein product, partial [Ixodes pacificus]
VLIRFLGSGDTQKSILFGFLTGHSTSVTISSPCQALWQCLVLMAVVDARYRFLLVDIGRPGSESDGGILSRSEIGLSLEKGTLGFPPLKSLPGTSKDMPFVIAGDEAFPLKTYLLKPYPKVDINKNQHDEGRGEALKKRVFNYRLSRARRVSENAFGILSNRWRIFRTFEASEKNTIAYIGAYVALQNFLLSE